MSDEAIHKHWRFMAYDEYDEATKMAAWAVSVTVDGYVTEDEARVAAQSIVTRKCYRLQAVWECSTCRFQSRMVNALEQQAG